MAPSDGDALRLPAGGKGDDVGERARRGGGYDESCDGSDRDDDPCANHGASSLSHFAVYPPRREVTPLDSGRSRDARVFHPLETHFMARVLCFTGWIRHEHAICVSCVRLDPFAADETEATTRESSLLALLGDLDQLRVAHDLVDRHSMRGRVMGGRRASRRPPTLHSYPVIDFQFLTTYSAVRHAVAWIVCVGFRPADFGKGEPPRIPRFGTSWEIPHLLTTLMLGSSPILVP